MKFQPLLKGTMVAILLTLCCALSLARGEEGVTKIESGVDKNGSLSVTISGYVDWITFDRAAVCLTGLILLKTFSCGHIRLKRWGILGSNLGPTNQKLITDVEKLKAENPGKPVPIDLVTTSGSGLDPHLSPAAAEFQVPRVARERGMSEDELRRIVPGHSQATIGFPG